MALFGKTLKLFDKKQNETITVVPSPNEYLHIANCVDCTFTVASPACKCAIERCNGVKVTFQERLRSGQMEVMFSKDVTITVEENITMHVIVVDNSSGVNMHLRQPKNVGIIHTVNVDDVVVHLDPPHAPQKLEHPSGEEGEFMTRCTEEGKIFTDRVARVGGGYVTTEREKELAEKKAELFEKKLTEFVNSLIKTSPATGDSEETQTEVTEPATTTAE